VPLLFFLFLASGKVNFNKLPILTTKVLDVEGTTSFHNKVSVVSIVGESPTVETYQKVLNLYQVIYKSTSKYTKFQIVTILPEEAIGSIEKLKKELRLVGATSLDKWQFVTLPTEDIKGLLASFETPSVYDKGQGVTNVFIVDEKLQLRGRTDDEDTENGVLFGYDTGSIAVLKNKLREDLKVIFYESKFAVK